MDLRYYFSPHNVENVCSAVAVIAGTEDNIINLATSLSIDLEAGTAFITSAYSLQLLEWSSHLTEN